MRKNLLTMVGTIDQCWLFAYQTPVAEARAWLPRELEPVTRRGFAFWNVVFCHIRAMRPRLLPSLCGLSYWHVAYRLYVRFRPVAGEPIEGLYFARSDCDRRLMAAAGNLLTDYNFHAAGIRVAETEQRVELEVVSADAPAHAVVQRTEPPELPTYSAFDTLEEAADFLKYKPAGLSVARSGAVNVVTSMREEAAWKSRLVRVAEAHWRFFDDKNVRPEICYEVEPIRYRWNRGHTLGVSPALQSSLRDWGAYS